MSFGIKSCLCPTCGYEMVGATPVGHGDAPKPDAISICIACGAMLKFDGDMRLVALPAEEFAALPLRNQLFFRRAQSAIRDFVGDTIKERMKREDGNA